MSNLSFKDAIDIFKSVLEHCKKELQKAPWPSEKYDKILQQSVAVELAIAAMTTKDALAPVQNEKGEWRCAVCGCTVDFDIMPGIKGDFCSHCGRRIDWVSIEPILRKCAKNQKRNNISLKTRTIGTRVKSLREKKGLTQTQLAELLNKSLRTVQKYESGEILPPLDMIDELAAALNTTSAVLLGFDSF